MPERIATIELLDHVRPLNLLIITALIDREYSGWIASALAGKFSPGSHSFRISALVRPCGNGVSHLCCLLEYLAYALFIVVDWDLPANPMIQFGLDGALLVLGWNVDLMELLPSRRLEERD